MGCPHKHTESTNNVTLQRPFLRIESLGIFQSPFLPGHFQHDGEIADPGSQARVATSSTSSSVRALLFYRVLGSALRLLVDIHHFLPTHTIMCVQR